MKIATVQPPPPPQEFQMTFTRDEGWSLVAALQSYGSLHPEASRREEWIRWAKELDTILRNL